MRTKKNSTFSLEELEARIAELTTRKQRMEGQRDRLNEALLKIDGTLRGLYAKRTIELNLSLPLEEITP